MIEIKQLTKQFEDGTTALSEIDVDIQAGELTCIIGPSGCGKTTLLKHINRLISPTSGDIHIDGESIYDKDVVELRRSIGYVIQQIGLFPHMTIAENITVVPKLLGWSKEKRTHRVEEMLEMVKLEPEVFKDRYPLELSGGQQQRVGVARALVSNPNIILMDEPFSALDPISREQLQDHLKELHHRLKKTIVFVTHDMDEALKIADRVVILRSGEVEQIGTPEEVLRQPASDFIRSFLGEERITRFMRTSSQTIRNYEEWLISSYHGESVEMDDSTQIDELIPYFIEKNYQSVKVTQEGRVKGYLTKDRLLEALASERGDHS
ncbi:glycine/betaine ABC transporter ATP-binding protein [Halalkalibacillus sediminis]|uniref:Quaternary amine transport ATP-binding protein n=1 Tax=Halalkalibacillus sediminis TaxID=2018042 RepID=A0A2I0QSH4_9BACI|nr:ABC transporter ATP-binding protein [Halalkalibacillus sediminis]PKR77258.1 glycine/betaine ABC transporter ATP-binding protein [Halalkalibacillus sediminis]